MSEMFNNQRFYDRTLAWPGHRLVVWGCRLQERYGVARMTDPQPIFNALSTLGYIEITDTCQPPDC